LRVSPAPISRPKAGTSARSSHAELGRQSIIQRSWMLMSAPHVNRAISGELFFSINVDAGMQRQVI
jgi:hypothetical protein